MLGGGVQVYEAQHLSLFKMGKSPGKWIKAVLFGKKTSKSSFTKGKEKAANEKEVWVASKAPETDLAVDPPIATHLISSTVDKNEEKLELEHREAANSPCDGGILQLENENTDEQVSTQLGLPNNPERIRLELAATKAQAAFRGYMARRAFRALKGIIRLQALVRGHLVRRQAVSTLRCMLGIVKLQALVRGRRVRRSDIGIEVQKYTLVKTPEGKIVDLVGVGMSTRIVKLSANSFVCKLLTSSPSAMPLHLQYDPVEPNSVQNWLEYWSASCFWKPVPQLKKCRDSKSLKKQGSSQSAETESSKSRRSVRRVPSVNVDNAQMTSEIERPKRSFRKVSTHPVEPIQENPQNELEKVKRSLRKVHNPIIDNTVQPEIETEKPKPKKSLEKVSNTSGRDLSGQSEKELKEEITITIPRLPEPSSVNEAIDLSCGDQAEFELKPVENGELIPKEDSVSNENTKSSRKAIANGLLQSSPTLPSYMAATESAKAKLRAQGSPRFSQDAVVEKNNITTTTRRHSLPSLSSNKISSVSPRTQKPVQQSGKGGKIGDRAILSSRDGNAKVVQAEWRR